MLFVMTWKYNCKHYLKKCTSVNAYARQEPRGERDQADYPQMQELSLLRQS